MKYEIKLNLKTESEIELDSQDSSTILDTLNDEFPIRFKINEDEYLEKEIFIDSIEIDSIIPFTRDDATKGLHTLGKLSNILDITNLANYEVFRDFLIQWIADVGLTYVGDKFHQFNPIEEKQSGYTGCIILAESHVTIHTYPEKKFLEFDIYACNIFKDNSDKVKQLTNRIVEFFNSGNMKLAEIRR